MQMKKGIIFDMDGTVWDSSENVAAAWTVKVKEATDLLRESIDFFRLKFIDWQLNTINSILLRLKETLQYLGDDAYYAYADMDELNDALLVTTSDYVFDDGDIKAATEASVFGYDKNGMIVEYGYVAGGGTATPLACKDSILFYGGHNYMNKVHIDENAGEMITDEGEYFDEYDDAVTVNFNPASK